MGCTGKMADPTLSFMDMDDLSDPFYITPLIIACLIKHDATGPVCCPEK